MEPAVLSTIWGQRGGRIPELHPPIALGSHLASQEHPSSYPTSSSPANKKRCILTPGRAAGRAGPANTAQHPGERPVAGAGPAVGAGARRLSTRAFGSGWERSCRQTVGGGGKNSLGLSPALSPLCTSPIPALAYRSPCPSIWGYYSPGSINSTTSGNEMGGEGQLLLGAFQTFPKPHNLLSLEFVTPYFR